MEQIEKLERTAALASLLGELGGLEGESNAPVDFIADAVVAALRSGVCATELASAILERAHDASPATCMVDPDHKAIREQVKALRGDVARLIADQGRRAGY